MLAYKEIQMKQKSTTLLLLTISIWASLHPSQANKGKVDLNPLLKNEESSHERFWRQAKDVTRRQKARFIIKIRQENPKLSGYQCAQLVDQEMRRKIKAVSILTVRNEHPDANVQEKRWQEIINKNVEDFMQSSDYQCDGCCCVIQ
jgi:hypothetical protein